MSHVAEVRVDVKDPQALVAAARQMGVQCELNSEARLYDGTVAKGHVVHLKGWRYPVVFGADGVARYDTYKGRWGDIAELNKFRQRYGKT